MAEILGFEYVALDDLLRRSDIITLHLPLLPSTQHLLNREAFAKCKRGALVINTARGGLIDTDALIEALDSGVIAGAGIDVLEEERVQKQEPVNISSPAFPTTNCVCASPNESGNFRNWFATTT